MASIVALAGFMGCGKTAAGRCLARLWECEFVDLDAEVEKSLGMPIDRFFAEQGETQFRAQELRVLTRLLAEREQGGSGFGASRGEPLAGRGQGRLVLALGGGTVLSAEARQVLAQRCTVVWLGVSEDKAWERVRGSARPLARNRGRFSVLHEERDRIYASVADYYLDTSDLDPEQVAFRLSALLGAPSGEAVLPWRETVRGDTCESRIEGGLGVRTQLHVWFRDLANQGRRPVVVTDQHVARAWTREIRALTEQVAEEKENGNLLVLPAGETTKSVETAARCWERLAEARVRRDDVLVALGGGVVGDLTGFLAATYLRGLELWQVPTSVIAQVDSSVGGKVAINLPQGKNLVGAFYQPQRVLVDPVYLLTLPPEEVKNGLGEVVKYSLLVGEEFFRQVEEDATALVAVEPERWALVTRRCIGYKADVVRRDERERGERAVLNLGHTTAHAIERCLGYGVMGHGVAVGLGLLVALKVSESVLGCPPEIRRRTAALMRALGLPTRLALPESRQLIDAMEWDKKRGSRAGFFVGLRDLGEPVTGLTVGSDELVAALESVRA